MHLQGLGIRTQISLYGIIIQPTTCTEGSLGKERYVCLEIGTHVSTDSGSYLSSNKYKNKMQAILACEHKIKDWLSFEQTTLLPFSRTRMYDILRIK